MDFDSQITTAGPQETAHVGEELGAWVGEGGACVVCLYGQLGSGKTTFAQGFAKALGVSSRLLSPTFIIVRRYRIPKDFCFLYHIDLYRVEGEKDLLGLGIQEILSNPDSVVLVEWAEKMRDLLPKQRIDIYFEVLEDGKHKIWKMKQS